jgi:hypothetical protein
MKATGSPANISQTCRLLWVQLFGWLLVEQQVKQYLQAPVPFQSNLPSKYLIQSTPPIW